jgi:asparagine synthase (glutamine-hydrolysing)
MADRIAHRGPDDHGVAVIGPCGLGHRRLSIIDLSPLGHQPMQTEDGRVTIAFNGEIYNFPELRAELEQAGIRFKSRSDTEVLLRGYVHWGREMFVRLNGMFAFALWDQCDRRLTLVRDRFGIKPLYYRLDGKRLAFGSEIKAVLASGSFDHRINWQAFHEYLYYGNPLRANTMFEGIKELLPGQYLTFDESGVKFSDYYKPEQVRPVTAPLTTVITDLRDRFEQAVKRHLISDVPVGVFLSGGVDSSAITAYAVKHYGGKLKTYSVGFDFDRGVNELPKARRVADYYGTDHQELNISGPNMPDIIERLVRCHDEPFGDAADIPLYLLCEKLRGSVKVVLQGDGGDEMFAGYRRYNVLAYEKLWRFASFFAVPTKIASVRSTLYHRGMRFFQLMNQSDPGVRMALFMTQEPLDDPPTSVLSKQTMEHLTNTDAFATYKELCSRFRHLDPVQRMLYVDSMVLLADQFLEKVDKSTMAHSIEVRVPFLDTQLAEYAMGLPARMKIRRGQKKWILREALRGIVPNDILDGPKTGFGVPFEYWLAQPLAGYMKSILLDEAVTGWNIFDRPALERTIEDHIAGRRNKGFLLWKLLNFALWKRFYDVQV